MAVSGNQMEEEIENQCTLIVISIFFTISPHNRHSNRGEKEKLASHDLCDQRNCKMWGMRDASGTFSQGSCLN